MEDIGEFCEGSRLPMLRKFMCSNNKKLRKLGGSFAHCYRLEELTMNNCSL